MYSGNLRWGNDYFSFHRTKMNAIKSLTDDLKIPIDKIDGGFEFNEWNFSHLYTWKMSNDPNKLGRFWPIIDDEFIVTVTKIDGYYLHKVFQYNKWLLPGKVDINIGDYAYFGPSVKFTWICLK